ncbi:6277_t:CDS:1 [Funneliformis geosporum]|uniref:6405_t:CDS:1 n=1 Tax=Funneliformis geosporum TaxID=1117311 RepID=A0A9W4SH84_9GLOM|nr:6277_t:CDS:1 [Funneliformis geosporum]CAI2169485.1 6405_t:CDS:1 [Funneliformis geosporum]
MTISDQTLFKMVIFIAFVHGEFITSENNNWDIFWTIGSFAVVTIGNLSVSPFFLTAMIRKFEFMTADAFGTWIKSLSENNSFISILETFGTASFEVFEKFINKSLRHTLGEKVGPKLTEILDDIPFTEKEKQYFERFVQIEDTTLNNMVILTLMPALLYNDLMLKCFIDAFTSSSSFVTSKLFRFDFKDDNSTRLKSEEGSVNDTIYTSLINNFEVSRVKYIWKGEDLVGYNLDLNDYEISDVVKKILVAIWKKIIN